MKTTDVSSPNVEIMNHVNTIPGRLEQTRLSRSREIYMCVGNLLEVILCGFKFIYLTQLKYTTAYSDEVHAIQTRSELPTARILKSIKQ